MKYVTFPTPFGDCLLGWDEKGVAQFDLPGFKSAVAVEQVPPAWVSELAARIQMHLGGIMQDFSNVPFDFERVTPFQKEVLQAALSVPPGEIRTYGWLANKIGRDASASRAVGGALGRNPWPLLVPCHRFVGANGKLTGFSAEGGIETKRRLLKLEEAATSLLNIAAAI